MKTVILVSLFLISSAQGQTCLLEINDDECVNSDGVSLRDLYNIGPECECANFCVNQFEEAQDSDVLTCFSFSDTVGGLGCNGRYVTGCKAPTEASTETPTEAPTSTPTSPLTRTPPTTSIFDLDEEESNSEDFIPNVSVKNEDSSATTLAATGTLLVTTTIAAALWA